MSRQPVVMVVPASAAAAKGAMRFWRSPGVLQALAAKLWLILFIYATSNVIDDFFTMLVVAFLGFVLVLWWGLTLVLHFVGTVAGQLGPGFKGRIRFLLLPLIMIAAFYVWQYRPGMYIRLLWSMAPLQAFCDFDAKDFSPEDTGKWVGLFQVSAVDARGTTVRIRTTSAGQPAAGLIFVPSGKPAVEGGERVAPLVGSWWAWYPDPEVRMPANVSRMGEWLHDYTGSIGSLQRSPAETL
jgi:hypothetical protein